MKIIVFAHRKHNDSPWSVGRVKRILILEPTDINLRRAEDLVAKINDRNSTLMAFWRYSA